MVYSARQGMSGRRKASEVYWDSQELNRRITYKAIPLLIDDDLRALRQELIAVKAEVGSQIGEFYELSPKGLWTNEGFSVIKAKAFVKIINKFYAGVSTEEKHRINLKEKAAKQALREGEVASQIKSLKEKLITEKWKTEQAETRWRKSQSKVNSLKEENQGLREVINGLQLRLHDLAAQELEGITVPR